MDIREQDQAYKRGLVLGLTMAEIIILVLFCLLLALAAVFAMHRERIAAQEAIITSQREQIAELETAVVVDPKDLRDIAVLREYWRQHAPENETFRDYFSQLALRVEELGQLRSALEQLVEKNRDLEDRASEAEEAARRADAVRQALADAKIDIDTKQGRERLNALLGGAGAHNWPPIITLSEADNYSFRVGSAELSATFRGQLTTEIVPRLLQITSEYDVNVIEVIGHTDEQPIVPRPSNLDAGLRSVLSEGSPITGLVPADNAGLGLARAVSVAQVLSSDERLSDLKVLPLSGGQLIDEDRMTSWARGGDVAARRRIEIRVRRSHVRQEIGG
jgi:flagellar motor protein MotB